MLNLISKLKIQHILIFAFLIRFILFISTLCFNNDFSVFKTFDSKEYTDLANELFESQKFYRYGVPEIFRSPGYPIFLLIGLYFNNLELITIVLQIIFSTFTIFIVYQIVNLIYSDKTTALIASSLYSLELLSVYYCQEILPESLFVFFLTLFFLYLTKAVKENKILYILLSSIFISVSSYIKPIVIFLILLLFVVGVINSVSTKNKITSNPIIWVCILSTFLLLPWNIRNYYQAGYWGFSPLGEYNLFCHKVSYIRSKSENISFNTALNESGYFNFTPTETQKDLYKKMFSKSVNGVIKNPGIYIESFIKSILSILCGSGLGPLFEYFNIQINPKTLIDLNITSNYLVYLNLFFNKSPFVFFLKVTSLILLLGLYIFSVKGYLYEKNNYSLLVLVISLYLIFIPALLNTGMTKYRMPAMPFLIILCSRGINGKSSDKTNT